MALAISMPRGVNGGSILFGISNVWPTTLSALSPWRIMAANLAFLGGLGTSA